MKSLPSSRVQQECDAPVQCNDDTTFKGCRWPDGKWPENFWLMAPAHQLTSGQVTAGGCLFMFRFISFWLLHYCLVWLVFFCISNCLSGLNSHLIIAAHYKVGQKIREKQHESKGRKPENLRWRQDAERNPPQETNRTNSTSYHFHPSAPFLSSAKKLWETRSNRRPSTLSWYRSVHETLVCSHI